MIVPRVSSHATAQGVDGLTAIFEQAGKHVLLANTHQVHAKEIEYIQIFNQKRVEGIVFYATHLDQPLIHAIQHSAVPVVLVGQDGSLYNIPSIVHDDHRVGFEAGQRLVKAGCKRSVSLGYKAMTLRLMCCVHKACSKHWGSINKRCCFMREVIFQ